MTSIRIRSPQDCRKTALGAKMRHACERNEDVSNISERMHVNIYIYNTVNNMYTVCKHTHKRLSLCAETFRNHETRLKGESYYKSHQLTPRLLRNNATCENLPRVEPKILIHIDGR